MLYVWLVLILINGCDSDRLTRWATWELWIRAILAESVLPSRLQVKVGDLSVDLSIRDWVWLSA